MLSKLFTFARAGAYSRSMFALPASRFSSSPKQDSAVPSTSASSDAASSGNAALHKTQRRAEKAKEELLVKQITNLETVAEQDNYTLKELNAIIQKRKEQMQEIAAEAKIPVEAILFSLATTLPMLAGSAYLYQQIATTAVPLMASFPHLFDSIIKLIAVHQCFQSGVHWGFAISSHDMQTDAINSTKEVRNQFMLACLPVIATVGNTVALVYGIPTEGILALAPLSIMAGTQLFILGLDAKIIANGEAPKWYLNMKLLITLMCFGSFGLYAAMLMNHGKTIADARTAKLNPYLEYLPKAQEIPRAN